MDVRTRMLASLLCFSTMTAASAANFDDSARVLSVTPQIEQYNQPRQECRTEYVQAPQQRSAGGAIIGGIAGGLLGNQVGGGSGRTAATAVGAITGAIVGDRIENSGNTGGSEQQVRQCRTVDHWETRTNGYAVTYEYHGRTYTSVMPYDPGDRVRLQVSITPRP